MQVDKPTERPATVRMRIAGKPAGGAMRPASAQRNLGRTRAFLARSLGVGFSLPRMLIHCLVAAASEAVGLASQLCTILSKLTMAPVTLSLAALGARGGVNRLVLAAATGAVYTVGGCEGLRRSISFNAHMAPLVLHYKVVQADLRLRRVPQPDRALRYDMMHAQYAAVPLGVALRLGGFYVKVCQVLSAFDEIVPRAYTDALRVLQDAVPARPASYVRELIEQVSTSTYYLLLTLAVVVVTMASARRPLTSTPSCRSSASRPTTSSRV